MTKLRWSIGIFIGSTVILLVFNILWLRSPGGIHPMTPVVANLTLGLIFVWSLLRMLIFAAHNTPHLQEVTSVRPFLSLGMSLLFANGVALYMCGLKFCFLFVVLNLAVAVGWYVGRKIMLRHAHRGGDTR
jgi:hypothetical protein